MSGYPEKVSRLACDDTGFWLAGDGAPDLTVRDFSGKGPAGTAPRRLRCYETITALAWRPGAAGHLASGGHDGTVALWHATAGQQANRLRPVRTLDDVDSAVAAPAWAGPHLLITAQRDGRVRAYGPRGGRISTAVLRDATHWDDVVTKLGYEHLRRHDPRTPDRPGSPTPESKCTSCAGSPATGP